MRYILNHILTLIAEGNDGTISSPNRELSDISRKLLDIEYVKAGLRSSLPKRINQYMFSARTDVNLNKVCHSLDKELGSWNASNRDTLYEVRFTLKLHCMQALHEIFKVSTLHRPLDLVQLTYHAAHILRYTLALQCHDTEGTYAKRQDIFRDGLLKAWEDEFTDLVSCEYDTDLVSRELLVDLVNLPIVMEYDKILSSGVVSRHLLIMFALCLDLGINPANLISIAANVEELEGIL